MRQRIFSCMWMAVVAAGLLALQPMAACAGGWQGQPVAATRVAAAAAEAPARNSLPVTPRARARQAVVQTAKRFLGRAYGSPYHGIRLDCSGLVQTVFAANGYMLPRTAHAQARVGEAVPRSQVRAGDLLFFTDVPGDERVTHVGIALGHGRMLHASSGRDAVVIDPLRWPYYQLRWRGARRIVGVLPRHWASRPSPHHRQ